MTGGPERQALTCPSLVTSILSRNCLDPLWEYSRGKACPRLLDLRRPEWGVGQDNGQTPASPWEIPSDPVY